MYGLDLFTGGLAGFTVALAPWVETLAYCEIDTDAQRVLLSRMADGEIPTGPIWDDIRTLSGGFLPPVDIITAGFPCQDISVAGKQAGIGRDTRSGLFWEVVRLTDEIGPRGVFVENVGNAKKFTAIFESAFRSIGYRLIGGFMSAWAAGAPHERVRWFGLAYPDDRRELQNKQVQTGWNALNNGCEFIPDAYSTWKLQPGGCLQKLGEWFGNGREIVPDAQGVGRGIGLEILSPQQSAQQQAPSLPHTEHGRREGRQSLWEGAGTVMPLGHWPDEPDFPRVAHGIPRRVDRVKHCGNGLVWLPARLAFLILCDIAGIELLKGQPNE